MNDEERRDWRNKIFSKKKLTKSDYMTVFTDTYKQMGHSEEEAEKLAEKEFYEGKKRKMWKLLVKNAD